MKDYKLGHITTDAEVLPWIGQKIEHIPPRLRWLFFIMRISYFKWKLTYGDFYLFLYYQDKKLSDEERKKKALNAIIKLIKYNLQYGKK